MSEPRKTVAAFAKLSGLELVAEFNDAAVSGADHIEARIGPLTRAASARRGAMAARYMGARGNCQGSRPAAAAEVQSICDGFGGRGGAARPKRRFVNFSLVCVRATESSDLERGVALLKTCES